MKRNNTIIVTSIILVLLIMGAVALFMFIPTGQQIIAGGSQVCPDGKTCTVTPILKCETTEQDARVIFRTNANQEEDFKKDGVWISVDTAGYGVLEGYIRTGGTVSSTSPPSGDEIITRTQFFNKISKASDRRGNKRILVWYSKTGYYYEESDLVSEQQKQNTPLEPYASNDQEKYSGDLYVCSYDIYISGEFKETLEWSKTTPTPTAGLRGNTYTLQGGEEMTGVGKGEFKVDYEVHDIPVTSCQASDGTTIQIGEKLCTNAFTLETCTSGNPPRITIDERDEEGIARCINGAWQNAYTIIVTTEQDNIYLGEEFVVNFDLDAPVGSEYSVKNRGVIATLYDGFTVVDTQSSLTDNRGKITFTLEPTSTGFRSIKLTMQHPEANYEGFIQGLRVEQAMILSTYQGTPEIQYDNELIKIRVTSTRGDSLQSVDMIDWEIEKEYIVGTAIISPSEYQTDHISGSGIYFFKYNLQGDGTLRFRIRGQSSEGAWTEWTQWKTIAVKKTTLRIADYDFPDAGSCEGSYTLRLTLKDDNNNLVEDANVEVRVESSSPDETRTATSEGNGEYYFTYTFTKADQYYFHINMIKGSVQGSTGEAPLPVGINSCGGGGGGGDETDWTMYLVFGGFGLAIVLFVYFVFIRKKKK